MTLKEIEKEFYDKKREYEKMYREEMEKELERVGFKDVDVMNYHHRHIVENGFSHA